VEDNAATFLMTNMMPQTPDNNRNTWEGLESYSRELVRQGRELYIIAGPTGDRGKLKNKVTIPTSTWKVVVVLDRPGVGLNGVTKNTRVIAVNIPNEQEINNDWRAYKVSVDELEKLTGYDFLSVCSFLQLARSLSWISACIVVFDGAIAVGFGGKITLKQLPTPTSLVKWTCPPCSSTNCLTRAKPNPVPS
jgi:DNA/RNA non-specific endonuclease